jgi:fumarylacetoacetase
VTWIEDPAFSDRQPFGPQTLPYGVIETEDGPGVAIRVGDHALPLRPLADRLGDAVAAPTLNPLLAEGREAWSTLRAKLTELVDETATPNGASLVPLADVRTRLAFTVGDYVDFYSSRHHAVNAGRIFRPDGEPLMPNWTHLPVGYHGRAGTVYVSGTEVRRPLGQRPGKDGPTFGPCQRLDVEAEVGFVCGGPERGPVPISSAADHIFGVGLVNDWSARDLQAWEMQPLGPFLAKSFATSLSAWITPLDALAAARVHVPPMGHKLFDYLVDDQPWGLDLHLEIAWNGTIVSTPNFSDMSYSFTQQLAHMTVNGATVRPGDLFASGTVSGPAKEERGSFLELSWGGKEPVKLAGGVERTFLEDGDTVTITATAPGENGSVVGIAEVTGTILAAED